VIHRFISLNGKDRSKRLSLYDKGRERSRFNPWNLLRVIHSPERAFHPLYLSRSMTTAVPVLIATGVIVWLVLAFAEGASLSDRLGRLAGGLFSYILFFTVTAALAAGASVWPFKGRGDFKSTFALLSYSTPWLAVLSVALTIVFHIGDLDSEGAPWPLIVIALVLILAGGIWTLAMYARAISIADDVNEGPAVCITLFAVFVASFLVDLASAAVQPLGIEIAASVIPLDFFNG